MDSRDHQIADGLTNGLSQRQIARQLGVTGPAIAQRIARAPELRRLRTATSGSEHQKLLAYRLELDQTLRATRILAHEIRRSLKALDEELQSYQVDEILELR